MLYTTLAVCCVFHCLHFLSLLRRALQWSAGSCSVTSGCWREVPVLSWLYAPDCGLKPSSRWDYTTHCSARSVICNLLGERTRQEEITDWMRKADLKSHRSVCLYCPLLGRSSNNNYIQYVSQLHTTCLLYTVFTTIYIYCFYSIF